MSAHISGEHSPPGGPTFRANTVARRGEKVLRHPCGCAHTDTAWIVFCAAANAEQAARRAAPQLTLEELLA